MENVTFTPTPPPITKRGRKPDPAWLAFRMRLSNPLLQDGQWYAVDLKGLSFEYARKQAIKRGFKTVGENGVLKVMFPQP